ncbi:hypothetical protein GQ53DRAFT_196274 [Thozetella sp. PMI_491]|nr:hypothetical protein GQ53DRAFT_196274 [Thozetella sp. PMI_491]
MDPRDQTFMTIHNLAPDANVLFASESIFDILGYTPDEVQGKSCFDYFHPDEVPFARSVHSRGVLLDKAAVLHYARILSKDGRWVNCECCFTVVHDVLVASTSIYQHGEKSSRRALEAPQIRRIFSSSPRDPRYHMLEHLSPKFKMPPMEREPRAALILNRFTRNLSIMFATNAVTSILGLRPDEIKDKAFYECIQENCLQDAIQCLESAKANESIAYLRFWYRDPRTGDEDQSEDDDDENIPCDGLSDTDGNPQTTPKMEVDENDISIKVEEEEGPLSNPLSGQPSSPSRRNREDMMTRTESAPSFELEAVVSCTSDGLVVVLRKARPPIPVAHPPLPPPFNFENGLFAAPWGQQPIEPYFPPELLYTFRPPLLPQYMPLRECVKAAGGPPLDQLMRSIRDVAVFAWALTGINGNLANYSRGLPGGGSQPADGLPIWDPAARAPESLEASRWEQPEDQGKGLAPTGLPFGALRTGHNSYSPVETSPRGSVLNSQRLSRRSSLEGYSYRRRSHQASSWNQAGPSFSSHSQYQPSHPSPSYFAPAPQRHYERRQSPQQSPVQPSTGNSSQVHPSFDGLSQETWPEASSQLNDTWHVMPTSQAPTPGGSPDHLRYGWP